MSEVSVNNVRCIQLIVDGQQVVYTADAARLIHEALTAALEQVDEEERILSEHGKPKLVEDTA